MRVFFRSFTVALLLALLFGPAVGQPRSDAYARAESAFSAMSLDNKVFFQILMTAAGYFNGVPIESFSARLFEGVRRFQAENELPPTGVPDAQQIERLIAIANPMFDLWGFRKIYHPTRRGGIWVPVGLGLIARSNEAGISWQDPKNRLHIDFTTVSNLSVLRNYEALTGMLMSERAKIHYRVYKNGWFVISFTTIDGTDGYMRYHQDSSFVTGFSLYWNNSNGIVSGERIAILMSGSLWSEMTGAPFPSPPEPSVKTVARPPAKPAPAPSPNASAPQPKDETKFSSGTGFFVSRDGAFVTNAHVVENCFDAVVRTDDGTISSARIVAKDTTNDLAILKLGKTSAKIASLRVGGRLGEGIATFGYPHADILSTSGNFTLGNITALSGIGDDSRFVQISAPVQSGNSGGPLLDQNGNVVGVVTSKLNALKIAIKDGDLPQNVNFAVKSAILATFLDANRISMEAGGGATTPLAPADLADLAKSISGFVACKQN